MNVTTEMGRQYVTPLARWARALEIIIPAYMLGKSWGAADERNLVLFRAQFPAFLIDATEYVKGLFQVDYEPLRRFIATTSGALIGLVVVCLFAVVIHLILGDRDYLDSLRFTAVTLIPVAVMNGILSHGVQTLLNQMASQSIRDLEFGVMDLPWVYFVLSAAFLLTSSWAMGERTGVSRERRRWLLVASAGFLVLYLAAGLMILPAEWTALITQLR